jgi:predicted nucleic acid-binding protein
LSRLVLDASVALCWLFEDQATAYTDSVLDRLVGGDDVVVPTIWPYEIANVVAVAERRKLVNAAQAVAFLQTLGQLSIALDRRKIQDVFSLVLEAARRYRLSAYDASYLELAMREALPLATGDGALRNAARAAGVRLA